MPCLLEIYCLGSRGGADQANRITTNWFPSTETHRIATNWFPSAQTHRIVSNWFPSTKTDRIATNWFASPSSYSIWLKYYYKKYLQKCCEGNLLNPFEITNINMIIGS